MKLTEIEGGGSRIIIKAKNSMTDKDDLDNN